MSPKCQHAIIYFMNDLCCFRLSHRTILPFSSPVFSSPLVLFLHFPIPLMRFGPAFSDHAFSVDPCAAPAAYFILVEMIVG